jgi:hypothetical protein
MRFKKIFVASLIVFGFICLLVGLGLRSYGAPGGPDWAYWLGDSILSILTIIAGFIIVIGAATSPRFVRMLGPSIKSQTSGSLTQRILWVLSGLILILFGSFQLVHTIYFILIGCPAPGC